MTEKIIDTGEWPYASIDELLDAMGEQTYRCSCIKCGYTMTVTGKHCTDVKCPKCGGDMRRASRPGPGQPVVRPVSGLQRAFQLGREHLEKRLLEPGIEVGPNWYRVRQAPPGNYSRFRMGWISRSKGIRAVYGRSKKTGKAEVQSLMFDKKKWTVSQIRKWIKDHGFKIT